MLIKHRLEIDQLNGCQDEILKLLEKYKGGCDEIWLCLDRWHDTVKLKEDLPIAKEFAKKVRALGIKLSVEIVPLGHGEEFGHNTSCKDYRVDSFGKTYDYQYCWRSEAYRKEEGATLSLIAKELQPYNLYFDDDTRVRNWRSGLFCLCDNCIKEFNKSHNSAYTREDIISKIVSDVDFRKDFVDFSYEGIADFCYAMTKEIIAVSPETHMGLEHGDYAGEGFIRCIEAMYKASGKTVRSRSGAGSYNDYNPADLVKKTFQTGYQLSKLPSFVDDYCSEIENYPSTFYSKTVYGTCLEASLHFASGFNTASIKNWRGSAYSDESIEIFADCLKNCEKRRYYWKRLSDCNEKGGRKGGLKVFVPENYWGQKGKDWFLVPSFYGWGYNNYGIPVTFAENKNECYIFDEAFASVLSKEELIKLLSSPVVTSGSAIAALYDNGFGEVLDEYLGVRVEKTEAKVEVFTDNALNGDNVGRTWEQSLFTSKDYCLIPAGDGVEVLANCKKDARCSDNLGISSAIVKTKTGSKWFIQGFRSEDSVYPLFKRNQIASAINNITGGLSAECTSRTRIMLLPIENGDGKLLNVSILNPTIEHQKNIELKVKNTIGKTAVLMNDSGDKKTLHLEKDGTIFVDELKAWAIKTIFFE